MLIDQKLYAMIILALFQNNLLAHIFSIFLYCINANSKTDYNFFNFNVFFLLFLQCIWLTVEISEYFNFDIVLCQFSNSFFLVKCVFCLFFVPMTPFWCQFFNYIIICYRSDCITDCSFSQKSFNNLFFFLYSIFFLGCWSSIEKIFLFFWEEFASRYTTDCFACS